MKDLQLRLTKLEKVESSSQQKSKEAQKENFTYQCIWCDGIGHQRRDYMKEALDGNLIFYKDGKIHLSAT